MSNDNITSNGSNTTTIGDYRYDRQTKIIKAGNIYVYPSAQSDDGGDINHEQNVRGISDKLICKSFVVRKLKDKDISPQPLEVTGSGNTVSVCRGEAVVDGYYVNFKRGSEDPEVTFNIESIIPRDSTVTTKAIISSGNPKDVEFSTLSVYNKDVIQVTRNSQTQVRTEESKPESSIKYKVIDPDDSSKTKTYTYKQAWTLYDNIIKSDPDTAPDGTTPAEIAAAKSYIATYSKSDRKLAKKLIKDKSLYLCIVLLANSTGNLRGDITRRHDDGVFRYNQGVCFRFHTGEEIDRGDIKRPYLVLAQIVPKYVDSGFEIGYVINDPNKYAYIDPDAIVTEDGMTFKEWVMAWVREKLATLDRLTYIETVPSGDKEDDEDILDWIKKILAELILSYDDLKVIRYELPDGAIQYDENGNIVTIPLSEDVDYSKPDSDGRCTNLGQITDTATYKDHGFDKTYSIDEMQRRTHVDSSSKPYKWGSATREYADEVRIASIAKRVDSRDNQSGHHDNYPETYRSGQTAATDNKNANNGTSRLLARADHNHGTRYIFSTDAIADDSSHTQTIGTNLTVNHDETVKKKLTVEGDTELKRNLKVGTDGDKNPVINVSYTDAVTTLKGKLQLRDPNGTSYLSKISMDAVGHITSDQNIFSSNGNLYAVQGRIFTYHHQMSGGNPDVENHYSIEDFCTRGGYDGDIFAAGDGRIHTWKGDIYTAYGNIECKVSGNIGTRSGNIYTDNGIIKTKEGSIQCTEVGFIMTHKGDIYSHEGDLYTSKGHVHSEKGNLYTRDGDLYTDKGCIINKSASNGHIYTKHGNVYSEDGDVYTVKGNISTGNGNLFIRGGYTYLEKFLCVGRTSDSVGSPANGSIYAVNLDLTGNLDVAGTTTLSGNLKVTGNTTIGGTLGVTGATTLGSTLNVEHGKTTLSTLSAGASTLSSLTVSGATTLNSTTTIKGALTAENTSTFKKLATFEKGLKSLEDATVIGSLYVKGSESTYSGGNIYCGGVVATNTIRASNFGASPSGYVIYDGSTVIFEAADGDIKKVRDIDATRDIRADGDITAKGDLEATNGTLTVGSNYITLNGLRLYISKTAPTGTIPVGSIGIGWE